MKIFSYRMVIVEGDQVTEIEVEEESPDEEAE